MVKIMYKRNDLKLGTYIFLVLAMIAFGPGSIVSLVFIVLKLIDKIDWSWFYVLAPTLWGVIGAVIFAIIGFAYEVIGGNK